MKQWLMRAATAALLAAPLADAARAETLADAMAHGYEHSGLLEQNRALLRAADEDVAQANATLLPVVNWSASASSTFDTFGGLQDLVSANLQLSSQLTVYDGGAGRLAIAAQKENVLATRASLINVEQQVLQGVVEAYLNLRLAQEFVSMRENNVRLITRELRAAEDRFEVGEITRTDVSLAEAQLAAARSALAAEQGGLVRAVYEFQVAVGREPGTLQWPGPAPINRTLAEAKAWALRNHPSIIQAQHAVAAAELNIERAQAALGPNVSVSAGVGIDQDSNVGRNFSLSLSGPVYQGGRLSSQIRQFMSRRDASRAQLLLTAQQVEQAVGNAWSFLEVARSSAVAYERQVDAASVAFDGVREEASLGSRTTLDVLNAEQELLDARTNLISAQVDETIASYAVLAAMGLLTAQSLGLHVQIYDPSAYYNLVQDSPTRTSEQGQALERVLEAIGQN
ncbi:TolC family outer membrane protein [Pseudoroseicyclus tamaricis]|uniref:TolC family outer membrane protein n=1 Tax=Pseudoroseicyclus tamaricis TaxID=2705421 RepID=A0A6B2JJ91_9RHOB|nr:TolC family outer membrane protein [Pseudoroseicyclus tamaricis]NDV01491.1 TolC family outer membrane protein [Pseudoroseicyclus tamaricis]